MTPGQLPEPIVHNILQTDLNDIASALGIASTSIKASSTINVGAVWMTLQLSNSDEVRGLRPDMEKLADLTPRGVVGVTVFGRTAANIDSHIEVRSFAPREGIAEDPVCGSGNGCVAVLVRQHKLIEGSTYIASQGFCLGRDGRVEVRYQDNNKILLGGHAVTCVQGILNV